MFTGIVSDLGEVTQADKGRFTIRTRYPATEMEVGGSMSCDGCCLTMTSLRTDGQGSLFTVDVSNETRGKTTLGGWQPGRKVNLERSLRLGQELGGHLVTGHIDGLARIRAEADEIVCPHPLEVIAVVGQAYDIFDPLDEWYVAGLLADAAGAAE